MELARVYKKLRLKILLLSVNIRYCKLHLLLL